MQVQRVELKNLTLYLRFFFQAEDGIRDSSVTGVQTCALPISQPFLVDQLGDEERLRHLALTPRTLGLARQGVVIVDFGLAELIWLPGGIQPAALKIGRASCRERV